MNYELKHDKPKAAVPSVLVLAGMILCLTFLYAGNSLAGDSSVPTDFPTIQAAIDDAGTVAGDTINVEAGTRFESNTHITKSVTIAGAGIGSTIIDNTGGIGFFVDADDVAIRDLTIKNGSQAIRFEEAGGTIDNTTIERVSMEDQSSRGIEIHNNTTVTNLFVYESNFQNVATGIRVSSSGHLDGAVFHYSTFTSNDIGIYEANDGSTSTLKNLLVTGCSFTDHTSGQGTSIYLEEVQDALIEYNTFTDNRRDIQILKWYQAPVKVSNVVIRNNTMTGTTNAVLAIFNAHHTSGQTEFDGVIFENNTADTDDGSAVFAGAHSTFQNATPSLGGLGWDTVKVSCNNFTGITTADNGVRFFIPGVTDDQALGGASIDVRFNWWGTADVQDVEDLMQVPSITDFIPLLPGVCSFDNLGQCISSLTKQNCSGLKGKQRAECNHEQQDFCFDIFDRGRQ